jgi:hypothetical protein
MKAMTSSRIATAIKTPWHLWAVGAVTILWNTFGCFDYVMTQSRNDAYLSSFTVEQRAYFESFPAWMEAFWAFGVWGALAGSLLLLLRSRHAVTAFLISLAGLAVSTFYQKFLSGIDASKIMPSEAAYIEIAIWVIAILLLAYAWWLRWRGVLS